MNLSAQQPAVWAAGTIDQDLALTAVFEERAENLSQDELWKWSAETDRDRALLVKLKGSGTKLLSGPRGSGKSTLLRKAYFALLDDGQALPAYVNFSRSLALEPLFHTNANAPQVFQQWLIRKMIAGVWEAVQLISSATPAALNQIGPESIDYIQRLETGQDPPKLPRLISPSELLLLLETWSKEVGRSRCVLLLDDAAHAFSPEQQRDFFEVFRALKSRHVAAKAAVYPGITSYSPYFHVGLEAEVLEAWYPPDDEAYLTTMRSVVQTRLPAALYDRFEGKTEIIDFLALASFGLPRGFLNMLSYVLGVDDNASVKPTRRNAERAVALQAESVRNIFSALRDKLPRLKNFVDVGLELQRAVVHALRSFNSTKPPGREKTAVVAIAEPIPTEISRILGMAEYAGILRRGNSVSRGVKGVFQRYTLHYSIVLAENSLSLGKSYGLDDANRSLASTSAHAFVRVQVPGLLGPSFAERCTIDLAPCQKCQAPRISEDAKFCMRCGAELKDLSVYDELIHADIDKLPLTPNKIRGLKTHTSLRTVQDILLDQEAIQIRKVPYVGPIWSSRIQTAAQEYVSV
jgi:hypothetical protein